MGSTSRVPARQPEVLAASPRVRCAFSLHGEWPRQPGAWCPLPWRGGPFPFASGDPVRTAGGPQEVFRQEPGPVCRVGGGGLSGAEFAPFPSPLPPTSSGDGPALLWSFSVPLFCEPLAVCSGRLIFLSLSHSSKKSPSNCSQGLLAGPYPKRCRPLLSVPPPLAGGRCGRLGYFSAGSCF